jgi:hypothetical protein
MTITASTLVTVLPTALPDELLSNYLHRSALWNSYATFASFAKSLQIEEQLHSSRLIDIFHPNPKVAKLLSCLGMSEDVALQELTTLGYWQLFEGANSRNPSEGAEGASRLRSIFTATFGKSLTTYANRKQSTLRVCPVCLAVDDIPYFRRSHQLPLTRCCYLHGCDLISQCPACAFTPGSRGMPESAARHCRCGFRLADEAANRRPDDDCWLRLARYNHEVLQPGLDQFKNDLIRAHLVARLKTDRPLGHGRVLAFLREVYGDDGCVWIMKGWRSATPVNSHHTKVIADSKQLRTPHLCAVLSQLDESLAQTFARYKADTHKEPITAVSPKKGRIETPSSVEDARRLALGIAAKYPAHRARRDLASHHRGVHWFLMIFDRDWYCSQFRRSRGTDKPVPSIEADRRSLVAALKSLRSLHPSRPFAFQGLAIVRAVIRDRDWLDQLRNDDERMVSQAIAGEYESLFSEARHKLMSAPGKPKPLSLTALARAAGLTRIRAANLIKLYPSLAEFREEPREAYFDRVIRWGVPQALREGVHPTASAIGDWLGLPLSRWVLEKLRFAISTHAAGS